MSTLRDLIAKHESHLELSTIMLKEWAQRKTTSWFDARMLEQNLIIEKAQKEIDRVTVCHESADEQIRLIERNVRFSKKKLALLRNNTTIERLRKLQGKIKEVGEPGGFGEVVGDKGAVKVSGLS